MNRKCILWIVLALFLLPLPATIAQTPSAMTIPDAAWQWPIGGAFDDPPYPKVNYQMIDDGPVQGAPLGGFGAGTFSRSYAGNFPRWHFKIGAHLYEANAAVPMFSVFTQQGEDNLAQALWTGHPSRSLDAWQWDYPTGAGTYYALYPLSGFVYDWDKLPIDLSVEQFSPIIPGDYQATSYPVALFNWQASNPTDQPVTVGIMFAVPNLLRGTPTQSAVIEETSEGRIVGVEMGHTESFNDLEGQGTLVLAAPENPGVTVTYYSAFDLDGDGAAIWDDFAADGALANVDAVDGINSPGAAIAITFELAPGQTITAPMAMAWDLPVMTFGSRQSWYKRYTAFFGRDGDNAWTIATDGLAHNDDWRAAIEAWQAPILNDESLPLWYKTALFNELYYVADGGTAWEHGRVGEDPPDADYLGHFGYLETFDYAFYNTFDVDFYASFALLQLWPEIEVSILRDFAATVPQNDATPVIIDSNNEHTVRKMPGSVPHDLGGPADAPWVRVNHYKWQNPNVWKDLNAKFVLRLYRDAVLLDRPDLVSDMWPEAVQAMDYLAAMDQDGDGIPENEGIPDQTYDTWAATGVSAYSGGLWVAALGAMHEMALMVGDEAAAADYADWLDSARAIYEDTLWNGAYYDYDQTSDAIMADQLAGEWYMRISGTPLLPDDRVDSALNTIYENNVLRFEDGLMGAVNGMYPDGREVPTEQGAEVWTGTTYMLAAHMLLRGLDDQGWGTAYGVYKYTYEDGGLWFRTPEAWDGNGNFRASMYMRPLSVWAMNLALARR